MIISSVVYRIETKYNEQFFKKDHGRFLNLKALHVFVIV